MTDAKKHIPPEVAVAQVLAVWKHYELDRHDAIKPGIGNWRGWCIHHCPHVERHAGGSPKPFHINWDTGQWKCNSTRCGQKGSCGGYNLIGFIEGLNFDLAADRRVAIEKMVKLELWERDGEAPTAEELAKRAKRDEEERVAYVNLRARAEKEMARKRTHYASLNLPAPPFQTYERDLTIEEIEFYIERGYWFMPVDPKTKQPATTLRKGKHFKFPWKTKATQDIAVIQQWLANGCRIGLVCGRSGVMIVDIDYKNCPLGPHDEAAAEFYEGWTRKQLEEAQRWQSAITTMLIAASGGNFACSPGGGFHIFFKDTESKYAITPLTTIEGSVFEWGVGWCEVRAGVGYVVAYQRFGDGQLRPPPDVVKAATHISQEK